MEHPVLGESAAVCIGFYSRLHHLLQRLVQCRQVSRSELCHQLLRVQPRLPQDLIRDPVAHAGTK